MDKLPLEIIEAILSFLIGCGRLSQYATISRAWQKAVERSAFRSLHINSTDLDQFVGITAKRRTLLRHLTFTIKITLDIGRIRPRNQRLDRLSDAVTRSVRRLLQVLADEFDGQHGLTLTLGRIVFPSDAHHHNRSDDKHQRIELIDHGRQFPIVRGVSHLTLIVDADGRRVVLSAVVDLVKRLPNLESILIWGEDADLIDLRDKAAALYQNDRQGLSDALSDANFLTNSPCPPHVSLWLGRPDPMVLGMFPRFVFPDCVGPLGYDPLSAAVRNWSYGLEKIDIKGVFDSSLFWPAKQEPSNTSLSPSWPRLKQFYVNLALPTPSGGWYFDHTPNTRRRDAPCEETLQPLVASWARALESMPVLAQARLAFEVETLLNMADVASETSVEDWSLRYQAPGVSFDPLNRPWEIGLDTSDLHSARLFLKNCGN